eukprot:TRINITY_DN7640_c0_g1_i2.p1 TRINITY_DN7640_c0_g1~~TRINITY_DN7640_c0_g1_i2.p1  ORF type:complete len:174 (+),score=15.80 TRINITY_DN7640_c0_g1_i2:56-523(+)
MAYCAPFATMVPARKPLIYKPKPAWRIDANHGVKSTDVTMSHTIHIPSSCEASRGKPRKKFFAPFNEDIPEFLASPLKTAPLGPRSSSSSRYGSERLRPASRSSSAPSLEVISSERPVWFEDPSAKQLRSSWQSPVAGATKADKPPQYCSQVVLA